MSFVFEEPLIELAATASHWQLLRTAGRGMCLAKAAEGDVVCFAGGLGWIRLGWFGWAGLNGLLVGLPADWVRLGLVDGPPCQVACVAATAAQALSARAGRFSNG